MRMCRRQCKHWARSNTVVFAIVVAWSGLWSTLRYLHDRKLQPDTQQRIAAKLVSWGLSPAGVRLPVSQEEISHYVTMLQSPMSEERVEAAWWLGDHGVRSATPDIVAAM